jgi:hypothetical protein
LKKDSKISSMELTIEEPSDSIFVEFHASSVRIAFPPSPITIGLAGDKGSVK